MSFRDLLEEFIGEDVTVVTSIMTSVSTADGDTAEMPLVVEGLVRDYNADWILLENMTSGSPELIALANVVAIRPFDHSAEVMADPNKPKLGDMN